MACVHNQAKIDEIKVQIAEKEQQISNLKNNINKCNEIKLKHKQFNEKINCVITNLEGNTVSAGVSYDRGKMTECLGTSNATITDCDSIIKNSEDKVKLLEEEIVALNSKISLYQGNCSVCLMELEKYGKG